MASDPQMCPPFRLCRLHWGVRIGLIGLVLTLMGGLLASLQHLRNHYSPRDGDKSDLTYIDVASAYHGVNVPSPLVEALQRGHPNELTDKDLPAADREALLTWLASENPGQTFDDESLGEMMPAAILERSCVSCHSVNPENTEHAAAAIPLFYFDDVEKLTTSREILPTPTPILAMSTHAHALALAVQTIVLIGLLVGTRLPRGVVGVVAGTLGVTLALDIGSWWLSRDTEAFVWVILAAGGVFTGLSGASLLAVLIDLVVPGRGETR
jgi:hypothetical protein